MSFLHHPRQLRARRWLFVFHLWAGLLVGFFLTVVGLTGSILVFNQDLQKKMAIHVVTKPSSASLSIPDLERIALKHFPAAHITYISLAGTSDEPASVSTEDPATRRGGGVLIHPQTGEVVSESISHEDFFSWIYRVHIYLLAGDTGYFFNGIFAFLATGLCLSGIVIWWPGVKLWRRALVVNRKARWKRVNYDLHRSVGFFTALALAGVFLTGAYFRFPQPFVLLVQTVTRSVVDDPFLQTKLRSQPTISASEALKTGEAALPGARTSALGFARPDLPYFRVDRLMPDATQRTVAVDAYSGRVLTISADHPPTLAERILGWSGPVHFGTWGGRISQVLWVFVGLAPGLLFVTGLLMYWNRVLSKKLRRPSGKERIAASPTRQPSTGIGQQQNSTKAVS